MTRERARAIRKEFRATVDRLAAQYHASQRDQYPAEYREREGARILREIRMAESTLSTEVQKWHYAQRVEAARLRHIEPMGDTATETRRLCERMEVAELTDRFRDNRVSAKNTLLPQAQEYLAAGNIDRARVYFDAAKNVGVHDGTLEASIEQALDLTVPHRRQAVEIEVMAQDEFELSRRDVAQRRLIHQVGTPQELVRASNTVKMADFKRQREAPVLARELGIELPTSTD